MNYNGVLGNTYRLIIRNGSLTNFGWGFIAGSPLSIININNVVFNTSPPINGGAGRGVRFLNVNSSSVNKCTFNGSYIGIEDLESQGGNSYNNDSFSGGFSLYVSSGMVLERCQFAPPPSN